MSIMSLTIGQVERYNGGRTVVAITEYLQRHLATVIVEVCQSMRIISQ